MQTNYGFAKIIVNEKEYHLSPTLENINKIGSPVEIVNTYKNLMAKSKNYVAAYSAACAVLEACGLPIELWGGIQYSLYSNKFLIYKGKLPVSDVFVLAEHCLSHGVSGVIGKDEDGVAETGRPLVEFDPHEYIALATEYMGVSLSDAGKMTMTQFVKLVRARNKSINGTQSKSEANQDFEIYLENARRLEKAIKEGRAPKRLGQKDELIKAKEVSQENEETDGEKHKQMFEEMKRKADEAKMQRLKDLKK